MAPLVSVIIPTHNRSAFLVESVQSVLAQTYDHYEIIVADDGSTDDSRARVAALDGPIHVLPLTHSGRPSVARNRGLEIARGDFIAFLDDDDLWDAGKLERQVAALNRDHEIGLCYTNARVRHADGVVTAPLVSESGRRDGNMVAQLLLACVVHPSTVILRASLLQQVGHFDESLTIVEDFDLWLRIARISQLQFLAEPLATIRRHAAAITRSRELEVWNNTLRVLGRFRSAGRLTLAERVAMRRTVARAHAHLGLLLDAPRERRAALWRALRHNPLQRVAWRALLNS